METSYFKNGLWHKIKEMTTITAFLNRPVIKEGIKNVASTVACAFGIVEAYDMYQILNGRDISTETDLASPPWIQVANKVILICAKISLLLSAVTSRPGVFIISTLFGQIFSDQQLEYAFGPNTVFALNPWHPRHIFSLVAFVLALPSVFQSTYRALSYFSDGPSNPTPVQQESTPHPTDTEIHWMTFINTLGSRPLQHFGNYICRRL